MQRITRINEAAREDEIEDALPSTTGAGKSVLYFDSGVRVKRNSRMVIVPCESMRDD
jgi:hypothetical protein